MTRPDDRDAAGRTGAARHLHALDLLSLAGGLLCLLAAGVYLLDDATGLDQHGGVLWAAALLVVGALGLTAAVRRLRAPEPLPALPPLPDDPRPELRTSLEPPYRPPGFRGL